MTAKVSDNNLAYFILWAISLIVFILSAILFVSATSSPKSAYMLMAMLLAGAGIMGGTPRAYVLLKGVKIDLKEQRIQNGFEVVMAVSAATALALLIIGWFLIR